MIYETCLSVGVLPKIIRMQPNPRAETSNPLFPKIRLCIAIFFQSFFQSTLSGGFGYVCQSCS